MPDLRFDRRFLSAALVAVAATSLAACDVVINSMDGGIVGGGRFKAEKTVKKSFPVGAQGVLLEVHNVSGRIEVASADGATIELEALITAKAGSEEAAREVLKDADIKADVTAARVKVETTQPKSSGGVEVKYTVKVPKSVKLQADNVNGTIDITGVLAGIRAETTSGSVKGHQLGGAVEASTTNGSVELEMAVLSNDGVRAETTNGSVTVALPKEAKASLEARCVNGGISVSDLPFDKDSDSNRRKVDGKINGGGAPLRLETVNGSVRVRAVGSEKKTDKK